MIIRDYLTRKRWYLIGGFILHLIAMTGCWWGGKAIIMGIYGGSAFILMFELQRGGNAITRTMLSLPVTADQLARCWRFVALTFPVLLFLIALVLSAWIGMMFGARNLTTEFFLLVAIGQTLFLGFSYFALTGIPGQPGTGATIWQQFMDIFFGLIWSLSLPAAFSLALAIPRHFEDLGRGRIIAGILLAAASVAGWFRADILVRNRAARQLAGVRKAKDPSSARSASEWKRFGALPYLCLRLGSQAFLLIAAILLIQRFAMGWSGSGTKHQTMSANPQIGMIIVMTVFVTLSNLLGQLRVLRTMPIRTSTLTHLLVFVPLGLAMTGWLLSQLFFSLLDGPPIEWHLLGQSLVGTGFLIVLLPLTLRFGLRVWVMIPVVMVASVISSMGSSLLGGIWANQSWLLAGLGVFLAAIWWISYRLLGTPHP